MAIWRKSIPYGHVLSREIRCIRFRSNCSHHQKEQEHDDGHCSPRIPQPRAIRDDLFSLQRETLWSPGTYLNEMIDEAPFKYFYHSLLDALEILLSLPTISSWCLKGDNGVALMLQVPSHNLQPSPWMNSPPTLFLKHKPTSNSPLQFSGLC